MEQTSTKVTSNQSEDLIEVKNLKKYFKVGDKSFLHAIDGVNFSF